MYRPKKYLLKLGLGTGVSAVRRLPYRTACLVGCAEKDLHTHGIAFTLTCLKNPLQNLK